MTPIEGGLLLAALLFVAALGLLWWRAYRAVTRHAAVATAPHEV